MCEQKLYRLAIRRVFFAYVIYQMNYVIKKNNKNENYKQKREKETFEIKNFLLLCIANSW